MKSSGKNLIMAGKIAHAVKASGGRAFYVGGCVRDEVLGRFGKDIDIEIHGLTEKKLAEILDGLGERLTMGASFGIFGLKHYTLDIVMPRSSSGDVAPFIGFREAARRRDFTMNALMKDVMTGEILDYFGGVNDINNKIIRHVDDETFLSDPLRVFRAARFSAALGFEIDEATQKICGGADVSGIAPERIFGELETVLLKTSSPLRFFHELGKMGQLDFWFPEIKKTIPSLIDISEETKNKSSFPLGFMMSLICSSLSLNDTSSLLARITNDNHITKYVMSMAGLLGELRRLSADEADDIPFMRVFDESVCPDDLALLAETLSGKSLSSMLHLYHQRMSQPYVTGGDIKALGVPQSPLIGEALRHVHGLRLAGVPKDVQLREAMNYIKGVNHD